MKFNASLRETITENARKGMLLAALGDHERANALRGASRKLIVEAARAGGVSEEAIRTHVSIIESERLHDVASIGGFYAASRMPAAKALVEAVLDDLHAWSLRARDDDEAAGLFDGTHGNFNVLPKLRDPQWVAHYKATVEQAAEHDDDIATTLRLARKAYPSLEGEDMGEVQASMATALISGRIEDALNGLTKLAGLPGFTASAKALLAFSEAMAAVGRKGNTLAKLTGSGVFYTFGPDREKALALLRDLMEYVIVHGSDEGFDYVAAKAELSKLGEELEPALTDKDKAVLSNDEAALDRLMGTETA